MKSRLKAVASREDSRNASCGSAKTFYAFQSCKELIISSGKPVKDERRVYIFTVEFIRRYVYYILEDIGYFCHNYVSKTCKNFTKIGNVSCILV